MRKAGRSGIWCKLVFFAVFLGICINGSAAAADGGRVWIDTDPSIGAPWREVDDAFALLFALRSPELQIAGVSTTYGNAGLERTDRVARELVARFGDGVKIDPKRVHRGARESGATGPTPASAALAHALGEGELTYVALGPLTNLAAFIDAHPRLARRIRRVVFVGGQTSHESLRFGKGGWLKIHDANVTKDPDAVRRVLASRLALVLAPVETSRRLMLEGTSRRRLRGARSESAARYLHRKTAFWHWFWTGFVGERGAPVFDCLAVLAVARPELVRTASAHAVVNERGELMIVPRRTPGTSAVRVCSAIDPAAADAVVRTLTGAVHDSRRRDRAHLPYR